MATKCEPGCKCGRHTHVLLTRYDKTCLECGKSFTAKRIDTRFCSPECGRKAYERENQDKIREGKARWQQANRERTRESKRQYEERHGERVRAAKRQRYADVSADPEKAAERRVRSHQWYLENRGRIRDQVNARKREQRQRYNTYRRRSEHGTDDWEALITELWEAQDGKCYLCGDPLDRDAERAIHLDHDHRCCSYAKSCERCRRGLACGRCNRLIGLAKDDPDRLRRIAANLERANEEVTRRMQQPRRSREPVTYEFTCKECGSQFTAHRSDALYCSTACYDRLRHRERRRPRTGDAA